MLTTGITAKNSEPIVLDRPNHTISRKYIDSDAIKVLYRLYRNGYKAYLVGGAVRDLLLGKIPKDFDIVTDAKPGQIKKLFSNCFLIGRRFRLAHIRFRGGKIIEVSTFRKEPDELLEENEDMNNTFGTPSEDAFRRDITINALFYDISNFSIIDYVGGLSDIQLGRVCIIGDPKKRYTEDPVRVWRVLRHAARTEFYIETKTEQAITPHKHLLSLCSGSRLFEELNKDVNSGYTMPFFKLLHQYGILPVLFGSIGEYYEQSDEAVKILFDLLKVMDDIKKSGDKLSQEAMYSILFWPWARHMLFKNKQGYDKLKLLNDAFLDAKMPITIPKGLRAHIVQTIYILDRMFYAMETGRMRWSLKKRARYLDASFLYSIITHGHAESVSNPFEVEFRDRFKQFPKNYKRKKRFSRKQRSVSKIQ